MICYSIAIIFQTISSVLLNLSLGFMFYATVGQGFHWWQEDLKDFKKTNLSTEMPGSLSLCSGVVAATLAETVQGRVTRFKWYRNIFKDCFSGCWQKVMQSVNGRSCSWMGNKKSVFLVAMALLHWLVSVWEGQSLVLHHHTSHPSSNFPVSLECVAVCGCEVVFRALFQAMF